MQAKVSILIPFYNCSYVDQAIESALKQDYENIEIVLIDDGSTLYLEKLKPYKKKIVYIKKENGGTATALNLGLEKATGDYIAWLSSDDLFMPDKISKQLKFMLENKLDASFTNYHIIDKFNNVLFPWHCKRFTSITEVYKEFITTNVINGCTVLIKKEVFEKVGGFNEVFKYTHDYEMWYRLLSKGYQMHYLDDVLTKFRTHENSGTSRYQNEMISEMRMIESYYRPQLIQYIICNL